MMSEGIELPPLDITESDQELSKALQLPSDLKPDSYNTGEWIVKITLWMGSARVCRERQLRDALKHIAELEQLMALPDENDPLCAKIVDSATFDPERQEAKAGGTIGDWMRRAKAAEAKLAAQSSPQAQGFEEEIGKMVANYRRVESDFDTGRTGGVKSIALTNLSSAIGEYVISRFDAWNIAQSQPVTDPTIDEAFRAGREW